MVDDKKDDRPKPSLPKVPPPVNQAATEPEDDILTVGELSSTENVVERASVDDIKRPASSEYTDLEDNPITHWQAQKSPDKFLIKAKRMVIEYMNTTGQSEKRLKAKELNIVWFSKTLQNWKALISTVYKDGLYFEVTYNGHLGESYVDVYQKVSNTTIQD